MKNIGKVVIRMAKKKYKLEKDQVLRITFPIRIDLDQLKEKDGILKLDVPITLSFDDPDEGVI